MDHHTRGKRTAKLAALFSVLSLMTGCATITNDPSQAIQFAAPGCGDVQIECTAQNKRGSWAFSPPEVVQIRRSDDDLRISCSVPDRRDYIHNVSSRIGAKLVASAVFLDLGIVDAITDKHRIYPVQIMIPACD